MAKTAKYEIDGAKLEELIKAAGYEKCDVSEAIGYSRGYLTECIRSNLIPIVAAKCIETMFKIPYDLYKPVVDIPEEEPEEGILTSDKLVTDLTARELADILYQTVYAAMCHALLNDSEKEDIADE